MNFELSEEQVILQDSVARFVADNYELSARNDNVASEPGFSEANWQQFAELGWLSVPFSEELGGFGGSFADLMVLMEEFGKGLVVEPYLATVVLFGGALAESNHSAAQQVLIPQIIDGSLQGALAYHERQSRSSFTSIETRAEATADGYSLSGDKSIVFNGGSANKLVVSARLEGEGIGLFLVDAEASGVERTAFKLMDGHTVANISLNAVKLDKDALLASGEDALAVLNRVTARAIVALGAEAQGGMQVLLDATVEYSKTRKQFGVAIGSFQALQHRMVDMFAACEQNRSLLLRTVCSLDEDASNRDEADISKNLHALKVMVGRAGKLIGAEAIQLHGGMGMTDELAVGHYAKRLMMINVSFGDADHHERCFADLQAQA